MMVPRHPSQKANAVEITIFAKMQNQCHVLENMETIPATVNLERRLSPIIAKMYGPLKLHSLCEDDVDESSRSLENPLTAKAKTLACMRKTRICSCREACLCFITAKTSIPMSLSKSRPTSPIMEMKCLDPTACVGITNSNVLRAT